MLFRKSWLIDDYSDKRQASWGLSLGEIKNPKEVEKQIQDFIPFKVGKRNNMYVLRSDISYEFNLFRAYQENGVKLNLKLGGGPSIAIIKPYVIEYITSYDTLTGFYTSSFAQYNPEIHNHDNTGPIIGFVIGSGGFIRGWDLKFKPGVNLKIAFDFQFGHMMKSFKSLEFGFVLDAFPEKIITIPEAENKSIFSSAYLAFNMGQRRYKKPKEFRESR